MRLGREQSCMLAQGQLVIRLTDPHTGWQVKWDINEISFPPSPRHEGGEAALNERKRAIWLPKNIPLFCAKGTKYKYRWIQCGSRTRSLFFSTHAGQSAKVLLTRTSESDQLVKHTRCAASQASSDFHILNLSGMKILIPTRDIQMSALGHLVHEYTKAKANKHTSHHELMPLKHRHVHLLLIKSLTASNSSWEAAL